MDQRNILKYCYKQYKSMSLCLKNYYPLYRVITHIFLMYSLLYQFMSLGRTLHNYTYISIMVIYTFWSLNPSILEFYGY